MIVRALAARLGGHAVLAMLSSILEAEADLPFAAALVQALNLILLTAPEAREIYAPQLHCPYTPCQNRLWSGPLLAQMAHAVLEGRHALLCSCMRPQHAVHCVHADV